MKKYKCKKCNFVFDVNDNSIGLKCQNCDASNEYFEEIVDFIADNDVNAIIDSILEDIIEEKNSKIINDIEENKMVKISDYNPAITRINEKCINCGQCKKICEKIVNISYDLNHNKEPICIGCGQCILNCPRDAIIPRYSYREVKSIIDENKKIVIAIVSPSVRVSIGESFGMESGTNCEKKLVTALKRLGFDYIFDAGFGSDLAILEEVAEFAARLKDKPRLPQFTSSCPAWVKYVEIYHPELLDHLSSCKSPIGMQCSIVKSYFCELKGFDPSQIVTVAITPCTSMKVDAKEYEQNIDFVLTTSELSLLIKDDDIKLDEMNESEFDNIMSDSSGGGIIFGASGGVCESAIRTLYRILTKKNLLNEELEFHELRGIEGIKDASITIGDYKLRVAVVQEMANLEKLLINNRYKKYHFIEVMNCKGGCVGGGGQPICPISKLDETRLQRAHGLYSIDQKRAIRSAHDNIELKKLYKEYLKNPLSQRGLDLLHTTYTNKSSLLNDKNEK